MGAEARALAEEQEASPPPEIPVSADLVRAAKRKDPRAWRVLFTQFQPIHARTMVPCQDTPIVRAPYRAAVTVPAPVHAPNRMTGFIFRT